MARSSYDESLARLLVHEGGYSNHPADPGGPTNFGITLADARRYWKPDATAADVRAMPVDVAKDIYRRHYWAPMRCDELPAGVDYAVFDYGVNSGLGRIARVLRRITGLSGDALTGRGAFTDALVAAVSREPPARLVTVICDERLAFLQGLSTWSVFGNGWGARVREVRAAALALTEKSSGSPSPHPNPPPLRGGGSPPGSPAGGPSVPAATLAWRGALVAALAAAAHFIGAHPLLVGGILVAGILLALFIPSNLKGGD
jgi:lysozyme family protein